MATFSDPTLGKLGTLSPAMQYKALQFINRLRSENLLPVIITSGRRTVTEQEKLVDAGRSWTLRSKHLDGQAFDVDMAGWNRDRVPRWVWDEIGPVAESIGLKWGGRWQSTPDVGHFEL